MGQNLLKGKEKGDAENRDDDAGSEVEGWKG